MYSDIVTVYPIACLPAKNRPDSPVTCFWLVITLWNERNCSLLFWFFFHQGIFKAPFQFLFFFCCPLLVFFFLNAVNQVMSINFTGYIVSEYPSLDEQRWALSQTLPKCPLFWMALNIPLSGSSTQSVLHFTEASGSLASHLSWGKSPHISSSEDVFRFSCELLQGMLAKGGRRGKIVPQKWESSLSFT